MYLSIVIKSLNEEARIGRAIESALAATAEVAGPSEVIIADSLSTDATVAVASRYPVLVVQLAETAHRGCGAGVQLGYQHATGRFVYLLDGDMELVPGFMAAACSALERDNQLGGVAGYVRDTRIRNAVDRIRVTNGECLRPGAMPWLSGGGLYRSAAVAAAGGYAGDRNLKAYEEADLGMRLRTAGWRLERLDHDAVLHTGHDMDTWALLMKHWKSRRAMASGVLLRQSFGKPWMPGTLRLLAHSLAVLAAWCTLLAGLALLPRDAGLSVLAAFAAAAAIGFGALAVRKRSASRAAASVVGWHYTAAAIVAGLSTARTNPETPLPSRVLHDARDRRTPPPRP